MVKKYARVKDLGKVLLAAAKKAFTKRWGREDIPFPHRTNGLT